MVKEHLHFDLYDKLIFEKVVMVPPFTTPQKMPNEACFLYAIRGGGRVYTGTEEVEMHVNSGVVMKCGNYLGDWLREYSEEETYEAVAVHLYPDVMRKIYDKELPAFLAEVGKMKPVSIHKVKGDEILKKYIDSLIFYFENPALVSDELIKLKLKELILLLAKTDNAQAISQLLGSLFSPAEYNFKEIIETNIYKNLNNDQLAFLCNMSLSSFKREFNKIYNVSPAKYFKSRKLERAAELLKKTDQRIGDIAFECGFSEVAHFSKSFLKAYGVSPTRYRSA